MIPVRLPWRPRARPSATLHEIPACSKKSKLRFRYYNRPDRLSRGDCFLSQQSEKFLMAQSRKFLSTAAVWADDRGTNRYEPEGTRLAAVVSASQATQDHATNRRGVDGSERTLGPEVAVPDEEERGSGGDSWFAGKGLTTAHRRGCPGAGSASGAPRVCRFWAEPWRLSIWVQSIGSR